MLSKSEDFEDHNHTQTCCMLKSWHNMDGAPMIECCDCGVWFHIDCLSPSPSALNNTDEPWYCTDCN